MSKYINFCKDATLSFPPIFNAKLATLLASVTVFCQCHFELLLFNAKRKFMPVTVNKFGAPQGSNIGPFFLFDLTKFF